MLDQAYTAYDNLELEAAEQTLVQALALSSAYAIEPRLRADLNFLLGIVSDGLYGDPEITAGHFLSGLEADRNAQLNPYYTNPNLDSLFAQALASLPAPPPPHLYRPS